MGVKAHRLVDRQPVVYSRAAVMTTNLDPAIALQDLQEQVIACRRCPRLVDWRETVAREKRRMYREWDYWGRPLPSFGDPPRPLAAGGTGPGGPRRQPHRANVYRRPQR